MSGGKEAVSQQAYITWTEINMSHLFYCISLNTKKDILVNMLKKEKKRAQDAISELESFGQLPRQSSSTSESSMANSRSNSRNQLSPDKSQKLSKSEEKAKQTICKDSVAVLVYKIVLGKWKNFVDSEIKSRLNVLNTGTCI